MTYKKYVILSASEISHHPSEKIYVAILFRWDSSLSFRMTYKKYVILSASEISHHPSENNMCSRFFEGIAAVALPPRNNK